MEHYSAISRDKVLIPATRWLKLKSIMLDERSLTQEVTYHMIPFWTYEMSETGKTTEAESRLVVARSSEGGNEE